MIKKRLIKSRFFVQQTETNQAEILIQRHLGINIGNLLRRIGI